MGIESTSSKMLALRIEVEKKFGKKCEVPADFVALAEGIRTFLNQHISPSTLERVWNYSTRRPRTISSYTINLLCEYVGMKSWSEFCKFLNEAGIVDSDIIEGESIQSRELNEGDKIKIGWMPDRVCVIEYLGDCKYKALRSENATIQPGDTFRCIEFIKNQPAIMDEFTQAKDPDNSSKRYIAGKIYGLSYVKKLEDPAT